MKYLNAKFEHKILNEMSQTQLIQLIGTMAGIIDDELEDIALIDDEGNILPKAEQPYPYIVKMMEILEYD